MKKRCIAVLLMAVMMLTVLPPQQTYAADWKVVKDGEFLYCIDQSSAKSSGFENSVYYNGYYYAYTTGWQKIDNKWYYFDPDEGWGYYGSFEWIGSKQYAFDENGVMRTGWIKDVYDDGYTTWYYAGKSGAFVTGWQKIGGKWYYFDEDVCSMYADFMLEDGSKVYLLTSSGALGTGWFQSNAFTWNNAWYYADSNGVLKKGWQEYNNKWYYFDPEMYFMYEDDSCYAGSKVYLFNKGGSLVSKAGWVKLGDWWYYANANGTPNIGWKKIDGNYYYFVPQWGIMETNAIVIDNVLYKFKSNGVYIGKVSSAGWKNIGGYWYYIKSNGKAAVGWEKISSKWYYFDEYGAMVSGTYTFEETGKTYYFDASGAMVTKAGWQVEAYEGGYENWYYVDSNGVCRTGWQKINNKWYYFDPDYAYMYADGEFWINDKPYTFDANGVWVG